MENRRGLSRRGFAKVAAAMPVALAAAPSLAQTAPAPVPNPVRPVPQGGAGSAGYIRPDSITAVVAKISGEPFAAPITFARNTVPAKLKPFALNQVRLGN